MKRILFILAPAFLLASCFHKDVMNDRADDVVTSFVYSGKEGELIITKEEIFQASSKESNGGMTTISGRAEFRMSAYDLATGELTGRADMGDGQEKAFVVLGSSPGKIWLYSIDEELGLHCRNPKTMDLISDEKTICASGPLKGFAFARPEWSQLDRHYGWKADNGLLMLSDMQGYHYYYDPEKNTLQKTEDEIPDYDWAVTNQGTSGYFSRDEYVSLNGDGRQKLRYRYEDSTASFSYLDAEFLLDCNPLHAVALKKQYADSLSRLLASWNDSVNILKKRFPDIGDEVRPSYSGNEELYRATWKLSDYKNKIDDLERELKRSSEKSFKVVDNPLLGAESHTIFIMHATDVSDTARMQISSVKMNGHKFTETWTNRLSDFYRDPDKADSKGAFETVFSDGDPDFRYQWFELHKGKLIIISQLQMICIDAATGKTVWFKPL